MFEKLNEIVQDLRYDFKGNAGGSFGLWCQGGLEVWCKGGGQLRMWCWRNRECFSFFLLHCKF